MPLLIEPLLIYKHMHVVLHLRPHTAAWRPYFSHTHSTKQTSSPLTLILK